MAESRKRRRLPKSDPVHHFDWSSDDEEAHVSSKNEGAHEFMTHVLGLHYAGKMSAKALCILCYHASRAGAEKPVCDYARPPGLRSDKYQRHLDKVLGIDLSDDSRFVQVRVPTYDRQSGQRQVSPVVMLAPHMALDRANRESQHPATALRAMLDNGEMSQAYRSHPVVIGNPDELVGAVGLYIDGVDFLSRSKDSVCGVWAFDIATRRRFLCTVIKKTEMCQCGCSGWCTLNAMWSMWAWSLTALAHGVHPSEQCDGSPWPPGSEGAGLAGKPMVRRMAVVLLKGDWAELSTAFGFHSWSAKRSPCCMCLAETSSWYDFEACTLDSSPWPDLTHVDYIDSCQYCEVSVSLRNPDEHRALRRLLTYDKEAKGGRGGRVMREDNRRLGLRKGDRLEPSRDLLDTGPGFDLANHYPLVVKFWRSGHEAACRHYCPIFSVPGVTCELLTVDLLHVFYLGVGQRFVLAAVQALVDADIYRVGCRTAQGRVEVGLLRMNVELRAWYRDHTSFTEVKTLQSKMLSPKASTPLKGAATKGMIFFVRDMLRRYAVNEHLSAAAEYLVQWVELIDASSRQPDRAAREACWHLWMSHVEAAAESGLMRLYPKHHQMIHLIGRMAIFGNPREYMNFLDESLNKGLARVAHQASFSSVWHRRVLEYFIRWAPYKGAGY